MQGFSATIFVGDKPKGTGFTFISAEDVEAVAIGSYDYEEIARVLIREYFRPEAPSRVTVVFSALRDGSVWMNSYDVLPPEPQDYVIREV